MDDFFGFELIFEGTGAIDILMELIDIIEDGKALPGWLVSGLVGVGKEVFIFAFVDGLAGL